jgi:hypothetical protein
LMALCMKEILNDKLHERKMTYGYGGGYTGVCEG